MLYIVRLILTVIYCIFGLYFPDRFIACSARVTQSMSRRLATCLVVLRRCLA